MKHLKTYKIFELHQDTYVDTYIKLLKNNKFKQASNVSEILYNRDKTHILQKKII